MKKELSIFSILFLIICLCGCTKTTVYTCTNTDDNVITKINLYNKEEDLNKLIVTYTYNYKDDDAYVDMKKIELEEEYQKYKNISGIKYKIKENYSNIIVTLNIDNNIDENYSFNLPFYRKDKISLILTNLKNNGYICK